MISKNRVVQKFTQQLFSKLLVLSLMVVFTAVLSGCEDDPILEPSEVDNGGGGSYGKMRLSDDSYYEIDSLYNENPEVY